MSDFNDFLNEIRDFADPDDEENKPIEKSRESIENIDPNDDGHNSSENNGTAENKNKIKDRIAIFLFLISLLDSIVLLLFGINMPDFLLAILVGIIVIAVIFLYLIAKNYNDSEFETESYYEEVKSAVVPSNDEQDIDVAKMMAINLKEIKEYYKDSRKQAKTAFTFALISTIIGMILILGSCCAYFIYNSEAIVAIITAIGGVISEFVAATSITIYKDASSQMQVYYKGLHENEKLLLAVNLCERVTDNREEIYKILAEKMVISDDKKE